MHQQEAHDEIMRRLAELKTIRDEIRLDLHLAAMDLRDEWRALERRLPDPASAATQLEQATADAIERLTDEVRRFRARLRGQGGRA